ncbi:hypothetical protein FACS1894178_1570 [Bacteroidia bacterium]|nr:hypothetical protein FACS1894178_1570 [Bacteroidia bacterium]
MKKLLLFLFLSQYFLVSASPCWERVDKVGWTYFSIADKIYPEVDSIRYIVSQSFNPENPTIFFSQGSGNYPLLVYSDYSKDSSRNYVMTPPFLVKEYVKKYNFVVIAKPGMPICKPHTEHLPLIDTAFGNYSMFCKMDFLYYYVEQLNQVVDVIRKKSSTNVPFFFIGNSQGGRVVAKFTEKYPQKVQRLVLQSTSIMDRYAEQIHECRLLADKGQISAEEAQQRINSIYQYYQYLKDYSTYFETETDITTLSEIEHYNYMTDASYNFDVILSQLQHIDCPILVVYGTADIKTRDNDLLPLFFTRWGKDNLNLMPIVDCNHIFVKTITDKQTNEQKQEYIGDEVFADIEKWLSK